MKRTSSISVFTKCLLPLIIAAFLSGPVKTQSVKSVAVYMSQNIPPYENMAREIRKELKGYECRVISLEGLSSVPAPKAGETVITIGKEAYGKLLPLKGANPLIYTMVLFPSQEESGHPPDVMGVAMIPSPPQQFEILRNCVGLKSLTIFVNPRINSQFVSDLEKMAPKNMEFSLRNVSSEKEFLNTLDDGFPKTEAILLIPEPTVLTEQGLKKLVRRSYEEKVPIIGFAPMYIELGAALSISVSEPLTAKVVAKMVAGEQGQWDRADGLCYSRLCEMRVAKSALERFSIKLDSSRFSELGCAYKEGP
ncbi:MAG TPA: hypothetical protein PK747_02285 [Acidobacteriota bacterium]|jgi:putative ABC transport system substrate-binding protein|nr:hypothetical protein [Acidobacteriota bacterium]HNT16876.1 hypothetical protein [Acidobacteriota bacterium]HPA26139.1 hypothetical protein [Acidobacteriota bacterium]HQO19603.1 hypothetical protein [Acidobacteriota bacterium]HQQ46222.1 hypothetical protein [Acidobacteriota bacterium]